MALWKFVKQAGLVLALFLAASQLWDWINKPSQRLQATVSYGPFLMPPQVAAQFQQNRTILEGQWITDRLASSLVKAEIPPKEVPRLSSRLSWDLREALRDTMRASLPDDVARMSGYWRAEVKNGGEQPLTGTRLVLPNATFAVLQREGATSESRTVESAVDLDTIHPGEKIVVTAWSTLPPIRPTDEEVRLSHASGLGTIKLDHPTGLVGQFVDRYWPPILIILLGLLFVVSLTLVQAPAKSQPSKENSEPRGDA